MGFESLITWMARCTMNGTAELRVWCSIRAVSGRPTAQGVVFMPAIEVPNKNVALFGLLMFALQSPGAPTAKSGERREISGQPCSVTELVGTWQLINLNGDPRQDRTVLDALRPLTSSSSLLI